MRLLQIPSEDLEKTIKEEIEKNPLLEDETPQDREPEEIRENSESENDGELDINPEDLYDDYDDYYLTRQQQQRGDDEDGSYRENNISDGASFHAQLLEQLSMRNLTERQMFIGNELIGYIDESGYITRDLYSLVDDFAFNRNFETTEEEVAQVLKIVQSLEPAGIGAQNLQECLSIQLHRMQAEKSVEIAVQVIDKHFDAFAKKHYEKICKLMDISEDELSDAIGIIVKLNPKPGLGFAESEREMTLIPDFIVSHDGDRLSFSLNSRNVPSLHLNRHYMDLLREISGCFQLSREQRETVNFIKSNADSANAFIEAIKQRYNTLESTMAAILDYQKDYFLSGNINLLRPMLLKDIATATGFDISTISRVVTKKYVQTHFGTFLLKDLFSNAMSGDDGEDVATRTIKQILKEVVEKEDKTSPLTDDELRAILQEKGFNLARRTVAKYRESMDIPIGRMRKKLKNDD